MQVGVRSLGGAQPDIGAVCRRSGESELVPALPQSGQQDPIHQNLDRPSFAEQEPKCVQA